MLDPSVRIGHGWDRHQLQEGRTLVLMGVVVDSRYGPVAHSDGDVVSHVVSDAILGALSCGDIGKVFPDDKNWTRNISGTELLQRTLEHVRKANKVKITQVDVIIKLEEPKLSPYLGIIEERLSLILETKNVRVTARHGEGVGAIGRKECIDATSVVLVEIAG